MYILNYSYCGLFTTPKLFLREKLILIINLVQIFTLWKQKFHQNSLLS